MICYLIVQKMTTNYLPVSVTANVPSDLKSTQRIIKLDINITDDAWEYPTVKVEWPEIPATVPPKMIDDLKNWSAGDAKPQL